ncbi:ATP-binding response regulator [Trinickia dinghuensis]|uniref:histidine kinase n=1 Tax=Trinickia dinghuensis TaxID=2291023 RepID=A0A3D8K3S4_9BURK|nr:response regulator [Trinickia dinghuensis]RDU99525.1 response regulator [Trinickia dinghuensis]
MENATGLKQPVDILVVDDLPQQQVVTRTVLEQLGENVIIVGSGREALKAVLERSFAVILLDVNMPGMDGLETASLLRNYKKTATTPIIFVTAYVDEAEMKRGYSLGAVDYISSPVIPEILRSKVKAFVEMHRMHEALLSRAEEREAFARAEEARAAAERARQRADFLAAASQVLTRSLEIDTTLERIVELVAGEFAELAFVAVRRVGESGSEIVARSAMRGPLPAPDFAGFRQNTLAVSFPDASDYLNRLLDDGTLDHAPGATHVLETMGAAHRFSGIRRVSIFPLVTGSLSGAVVLCTTGADAATPEHNTLLKEFMSRAEIAVENALLFSAIRDGDRRKNEFLAMLAHELRNPLAPIANAAAVMRSAKADDTKVLRWASEIVGTQVEHMVRIVEDLLDASRIARGTVTLRKAPVPLSVIVGRAVETSRPHFIRRAQTLTCDEGAPDAVVEGDVVRLAQVVSNLLNNASKFTPDGGHIRLSTRLEEGSASITVADDGQGIDERFVPHVFDLFAQADTSLHRSLGGLGIGLTLVRHLTELHGGSVKCRSDGVGRGAEFVVRLPATAGLQKLPALAPVVHLNRKVATRTLVVDDLVASAESLDALLTLHGFSVKCAADGQSALRIAGEMLPDIVVLDIGLPDMSGYDLARRLRREGPCESALIIALSGYGQEEYVRHAADAGIDHYLVKPADVETLLDLMSAHEAAKIGKRAEQ